MFYTVAGIEAVATTVESTMEISQKRRSTHTQNSTMQTSNDETMKFAATWLELKYNMLSDIR